MVLTDYNFFVLYSQSMFYYFSFHEQQVGLFCSGKEYIDRTWVPRLICSLYWLHVPPTSSSLVFLSRIFLVNEESLPRRSAGCPLKICRQLNQGGVDPANEGQLQGWQANWPITALTARISGGLAASMTLWLPRSWQPEWIGIMTFQVKSMQNWRREGF